MKRSLHLLDKPGDIVQGKPGPEIAKITGGYPECLPPGGSVPARQPAAQRVVDDLAEGPAGAPRFRLELGRHILVQGERGSHAMMLP
jgi:hypothetical protein